MKTTTASIYLLRFSFIFLCSLLPAQVVAANDARSILEQFRQSVYQVVVINKESGGRSSLGSGFVIGDGSLINTNYHVVSDAILKPKNYRIEVIDSLKNTETVTLDRIDIVNDLVLLKRQTANPKLAIGIASHNPGAGETVFSIGNPHDIGMTLVPGTYNGLEEHSFIERIHFSGSLNQGMSGGPALNQRGQLVGINVSTEGNQISFLVPAEKLVRLLQKPALAPNLAQQDNSFKSLLQGQIQQQQKHFFQGIMSSDWNLQPINDVQVIAELNPFFSCWGDSNIDKESSVSSITMGCSGNHKIHISSTLSSGNVGYEFWLADSFEMGSIRFYSLVEKRLDSYLATNAASDNVVNEFTCHNDFVAVPATEKANIKASLCTRSYIDFPDLYDVFFVATSYQRKQQVFISHFTLEGVNKDQALAFTQRFMRSATWL